jgi:ABC-type transport system involved in multi-copper enzyme maturation permease subunit
VTAGIGESVPLGKLGFWQNPIFQRELVTLLRNKKSFIFMALYVVLSALIVLSAWPKTGNTLLMQGAMSRELFSLFSLAQTFLLVLLIPATIGMSMTQEKEGETIDLLLVTPLSARKILEGKLFSGLAYFFLLAVVTIPILLLCFVLGGLSAKDVGGLYIYFFMQILLFGLTSLNCSAFFDRTHIAVIIAYVFVGVEAFFMNLLYNDGIGFLDSGAWYGMLVVVSPICVALYSLALVGVRRPFSSVKKTMEEEDMGAQMTMILDRNAWPDKLIVPPRPTGPLPANINPVWNKEMQAGIYGAGSQFVRWVIQLGLIISLFVFFMSMARGVNDSRYGENVFTGVHVFYSFIIGYIVMIAPALSARMFTNEKEEGTIESLLLTPLSMRKIVMGKFRAILRVVIAFATLNCMLFLLLVMISGFRLHMYLTMAMIVFTVSVFSTALGMFLSLLCRTTLMAMLGSYVILFILYMGPLFLTTFLTRIFPEVDVRSFEFLSFFSPITASVSPGNIKQLVNVTIHCGISGITALILIKIMISRSERILCKQFETQ